MANIKKVFQPLHALLIANVLAPVESILAEVEQLMEAKTGGGGSRANTYLMLDGTALAVFCYYHKRWFNPETVDFGVKKTNITGLNNFTTHGLSMWNKQRRDFNNAKDEALAAFTEDQINADELKAQMSAADEAKNIIVDHPNKGFATLAELVDHYGFDVDAETVAAIDESRKAAMVAGEDVE